jgi:ribosomal protein S18 acetylase RimI-like enzyme
MSPLAGLADSSEAAFQDLARISPPTVLVVLFLEQSPTPPPGWRVQRSFPLMQMIYTGETEAGSSLESPLEQPIPGSPEIQPLGESDVPEMLALTQLTQPGPFLAQTYRMGYYIGFRVDGRLVAMAGERLQLPGFTEISAVCTHPDFRGRGFAATLVQRLTANCVSQGITPFLHLRADNDPARRVYERLGFRQSRILSVMVLQLDSAPTQRTNTLGSPFD